MWRDPTAERAQTRDEDVWRTVDGIYLAASRKEVGRLVGILMRWPLGHSSLRLIGPLGISVKP